MSQALIINLTNARNFIIDLSPIKYLKKEYLVSSGVVLFFDKQYDMILFGESFDCIEDFAKEYEPEDAVYYHIIRDLVEPLTEEEIDSIDNGVLENKFSIHLINTEEKFNATICLN